MADLGAIGSSDTVGSAGGGTPSGGMSAIGLAQCVVLPLSAALRTYAWPGSVPATITFLAPAFGMIFKS